MGIKFGDRFCSTEIMYKQDERHIAICSMAESGDELLTEANARLISAAPYMLEALQSLENDDGSIPQDIWNMVQGSILKATGGKV
jgi:hypothetical protein